MSYFTKLSCGNFMMHFMCTHLARSDMTEQSVRKLAVMGLSHFCRQYGSVSASLSLPGQGATLIMTSHTTSAHRTQKRNVSFDFYNKYFSPEVAPIGLAQKVLEGIHTSTGLPWWASIGLSTIVLRGIVTLPLAVYSLHIMARVELLQPEIMKLSAELKREVAMAIRKFAWDTNHARIKYNSTMRKLVRELYMRENCHPAKASLVLWFQIPMWVCLSFALRNMSGAVPVACPGEEAPVLCPDLKTEGVLWFPDLTVPDSTWILPVLLGVTNLLNIEMHTLTAQRVTKFQKSLTLIMRVLSVVMVPVGAVVPSCMCYYWVCSSVFGLGQNVLFKVPSVRRLLRIPQTPSESKTPFQDMIYAARQKYILRTKENDSKS